MPESAKVLNVPGHSFEADGFTEERRLILENQGCFWHTFPSRYPAQDKYINGKHMPYVYAATLERINKIKNAGYKVIGIWTHEYIKMKKDGEARREHIEQCIQIIS